MGATKGKQYGGKTKQRRKARIRSDLKDRERGLNPRNAYHDTSSHPIDVPEIGDCDVKHDS